MLELFLELQCGSAFLSNSWAGNNARLTANAIIVFVAMWSPNSDVSELITKHRVVHSSEETYAIISVFHLCGWTQCPFHMEYEITALAWIFLPHIENRMFLSKLVHAYQSHTDYDSSPIFQNKLIFSSAFSLHKESSECVVELPNPPRTSLTTVYPAWHISFLALGTIG